MSFINGDVDNGRRGTLASSLYSGDVGVRERGDGQIEVAWFGRAPAFRSPVKGTLDGAAVMIVGLRTRPASASAAAALQTTQSRAIVATVEMVGGATPIAAQP